MKRNAFAVAVTALATLLALTFAERSCAAELDLVTPAAIYTLGGAADISASSYALHARPGLLEHNRFGLTGGVAFTTGLFFGADLFLQKHAPTWAVKALRWVYTAMTVALVGNSLFKGVRR